MLFGERQIWNRDIDKLADLEMFKILERGTGTPIETVRNTSLMAYKNWIVDDVNAYGNSRWILPLGIYHRIRRSNGIQYCPKCLADPKGPYYRRRWRLGFVVACAEHATTLQDECPACKAPISFHRREMGNKAEFPDGRIELCFRCQQDLSRVPSIEIPSSEMKFHHFLANSITNGWVEAPDGKPVYAHLYLDVLHQIMKLLISSNSRGLGTIVSNASGLALVQTARQTEIEHLNVSERHQLLLSAQWLLTDWPDRFIKLCKDHDVWSAWVLRDMKSIPWWYASVIQRELYIRYAPFDPEYNRKVKRYAQSQHIPT